METTIELPALRRAAELAPNSADTESRTVEVIWSAGARIRRMTLFGETYDEELSLDPAHVRLDRLNAGAPFLKVHELSELDAVIGSVVPGSARIENGRGVALVRLAPRWSRSGATSRPGTSARSRSATRSTASRSRSPRAAGSSGARSTGPRSRSPPSPSAPIPPPDSASDPRFTTASFIVGTRLIPTQEPAR